MDHTLCCQQNNTLNAYKLLSCQHHLCTQIWGCSRDEANHVVHEFFKSQHFAVGVLPMPGMQNSCIPSLCLDFSFLTKYSHYHYRLIPAGALHSLQRLKANSDLVVVTSRQHVIQQPTLQWLELHYPGVFQEVHFGNHWALEGKSKPKSEICRWAGVLSQQCAHVLTTLLCYMFSQVTSLAVDHLIKSALTCPS